MRTKDEIIQSIKDLDRSNKIYIHPVLTPETAAKYISAFSNSDGGDIVLGIEDDGCMLRPKNYVIPFRLEDALEFLDTKVNCKLEYFTFEGKKLCYLSIDKSIDLVKANNIPYVININGGLEELKLKRVFLSYCHSDSDLANIVEERLGKNHEIEISRDISIIKYKDDLDEYMKTIRNHDFVISIVTSKYIKSINCMYEITELMKDPGYIDRLLFVIVNSADNEFYQEQNRYEDFEAGIYDFNKRLSYITYWNDKLNEMEASLKNANLPFEMIAEFALEKRKLVSIIPSINVFMDILKDKLGLTFKDAVKTDFKEILDVIKN